MPHGRPLPVLRQTHGMAETRIFKWRLRLDEGGLRPTAIGGALEHIGGPAAGDHRRQGAIGIGGGVHALPTAAVLGGAHQQRVALGIPRQGQGGAETAPPLCGIGFDVGVPYPDAVAPAKHVHRTNGGVAFADDLRERRVDAAVGAVLAGNPHGKQLTIGREGQAGAELVLWRHLRGLEEADATVDVNDPCGGRFGAARPVAGLHLIARVDPVGEENLGREAQPVGGQFRDQPSGLRPCLAVDVLDQAVDGGTRYGAPGKAEGLDVGHIDGELRGLQEHRITTCTATSRSTGCRAGALGIAPGLASTGRENEAGQCSPDRQQTHNSSFETHAAVTAKPRAAGATVGARSDSICRPFVHWRRRQALQAWAFVPCFGRSRECRAALGHFMLATTASTTCTPF